MGQDAQQRIATVQGERLAQPHDLVELGVGEPERERFLGADGVDMDDGPQCVADQTRWVSTHRARLPCPRCR